MKMYVFLFLGLMSNVVMQASEVRVALLDKAFCHLDRIDDTYADLIGTNKTYVSGKKQGIFCPFMSTAEYLTVCSAIYSAQKLLEQKYPSKTYYSYWDGVNIHKDTRPHPDKPREFTSTWKQKANGTMVLVSWMEAGQTHYHKKLLNKYGQ